MSLQSRRSSVISPGSVALADILANSVAVILILILATLVYRQEQARDELERNTDVTTLLARQLASTVVFNDLPSSPPSILHDYESCAIPHDCDPTLFPVLEMHKGYLRIFNTNTLIYRAELLRQHNAFDRYLASLPPAMSQSIRLDIHSVSEYYLVLGILDEHGIRPRHWHYLGEDVPPLANSTPLAERTEGAGGPQEEEEEAALGEEDGRGNSLRGSSSPRRELADAPVGLDGVSLGGAGVMGSLNYDSLLPPAVASGLSGGRSRPSGNPFAAPRDRRGNTLRRGGGQPGPLATGQQSMRLYIPNAATTQPNATRRTQVLHVPEEYYAPLVLSYLFKLLETAREEREFKPRQQGQWLLNMLRDPQALASLPYHEIVQQLARSLQPAGAPADPMVQAIQLAPEQPYNRLLVVPNKLQGELTLSLNQPTPWLASLPAARRGEPEFLLRSYPSLYKGERLALLPGYTLLMLPDEVESTQASWRPVAVLDPGLQNIGLGFVYAGIEDGQLAIDAGVNQLHLGGRPTANPRLSAEDRTRSLTPALWLLALVGALLLLRFAPRWAGRHA